MSNCPKKTATARGLASPDRELEIIPGCIICKTCEFHAPGNFVVEEKALSAKVIQQPDAAELPGVMEAIRLCPEHVIKFKLKKPKP